MEKPALIVCNSLLMPLRAVEGKLGDIKKEMASISNDCGPAIMDGLFLTAVSYVESMQKETLKYFLRYNPQKIPRKDPIEIDKKMLAEQEDFRLAEHVISVYVDNMQSRQINETFYKALGIRKPSNSLAIDKIRTRRNELIHNNMHVYFKQKRVVHDHISYDYLSRSINEYDKYLADLKDQISAKYRTCTRINALKSLWHYTFATPLCAVFENFWDIDLENDSITGWKTTRYDKNLSHSETFMLGIWRSQVSRCEVDFLNMVSLDEHMQSCLYIFLKLSNDIFLYH